MNSELSRIHSLVDSDGTTHLAEYSYLGRDRTVQVDFAEPGAKFTYIKQGSESPTDGGDQYTGWDRFGRAIDLRWIKNSSRAELERLQHGYDRASNRLYRKNLVAPDADKQDELYTYDGLSQLSVFQRGVLNTGRTAITGTPIAEEDFIFDPTGNWNEYVRKASGTPTTQTRTHNKANELTAIIGSTSPPVVEEDAAGNMTKVPKPDSWSSAYDLKYDAWNRLVEVKDGSTVVATYAYDGLNRRTKKVMGSDTRHFYYTDKWQIIEERVNASTSADRQFVWGIRYTDDLVLRDKGTERLYVIQDYFQPTAVMDTSGAVLERYGYEAFGTSRVMEPDYTPLTDSAYDWETRFGAYRWDGETKMSQVRNRYLHTQLGRWVTRDPIGYEGGINLYAYVKNSPIVYVDPLGLLGVIPSGTKRKDQSGQIAITVTGLFNAGDIDLAEKSLCLVRALIGAIWEPNWATTYWGTLSWVKGKGDLGGVTDPMQYIFISEDKKINALDSLPQYLTLGIVLAHEADHYFTNSDDPIPERRVDNPANVAFNKVLNAPNTFSCKCCGADNEGSSGWKIKTLLDYYACLCGIDLSKKRPVCYL